MFLCRLHAASSRGIATSAALAKNLRAGVVKQSREKDIRLTYERSRKPNHIMQFKAWQSWNTSNLKDEDQHTGLVTWQDTFVRYFIRGVFHDYIGPDVIIVKRQWNLIRVGFVLRRGVTRKRSIFLISFAEEMLSYITDCPVKLEPCFVNDALDTVFKYT